MRFLHSRAPQLPNDGLLESVPHSAGNRSRHEEDWGLLCECIVNCMDPLKFHWIDAVHFHVPLVHAGSAFHHLCLHLFATNISLTLPILSQTFLLLFLPIITAFHFILAS